MAANSGLGRKDPVPCEGPIGAFVKAGETFYKDWVVARDASGVLVEPSSVSTLLPGGYIDRSILTAPSASDTHQANLVTGLFSVPMLSTSKFAAGDGPLPLYFENNREFAKSNSGRSVAGVFLCLDPKRPTTHAIALVSLEGAAIGGALERAMTAPSRNVRGVVYNNQADLSAFTVASDDGITYVEGNRVLLAGQTTAAQNGVYVVGTVATGAAPLTRAPDMPSGARLPNGLVVEVSEGTFYAGSTWKALSTTTGGFVVGTNDPTFYPKHYRQTVTLSAGVYTVGVGSTATPDEPLFLRAGASFSWGYNTPNTITATVGIKAAVGDRTAGKAGAAVAVVKAVKTDSTTDAGNLSTVDVMFTNW